MLSHRLYKRPLVYAAPEDREQLSKGVFLIVLPHLSPRNTAVNRQRAFEFLLEQLEQGNPPFDSPTCFASGLSEDDLIFITELESRDMAKKRDDLLDLEHHDIILAANEILELAGLKVDLAIAHQYAQQYRDLVTKVIAVNGGALTEEECQIISDKTFVKAIRGLAEAKVRVALWYENAKGQHELILNELDITSEEFTRALTAANGHSQTRSAVSDNENEVSFQPTSAEISDGSDAS